MIMIGPAVVISYLMGSMPFGYILGEIIKGIDIRKYGSGNIGATNALRTLGKRLGIIVLILDALKGLVCVTFIAHYFLNKGVIIDNNLFIYILGLASIAGHNWTIFLGFKGGKGVATTLGVLLGISFYLPEFRIALLILTCVWILVALFTRFVSLSSLIASSSLPVTFFIFYILGRMSINAVFFALLACLFIIIRHKDNIRNLIKGKERKFNF